MTLDITRTTHPATASVTLRRVIPGYSEEGVLWEEMMACLPPEAMALVTGPGVAVFHDADYREQDVDVEIVLPVRAPVAVTGPVSFVELPARDVVVATVNGSYDHVSEAMSAIAAWMDAHELTVDGAMYNRYLVGPAQDPDPSSWVTEVCVPVADR